MWTAAAAGGWHTGAVRGYGQYCPVAKAAEVLGERWTLLIVRELVMGAHRFNELQRGMPTIPRSVLSDRLRRLEADRLVERRAGASGYDEYWLTQLGLDLQPALMALGDWATRNYVRDPKKEEADPALLLLRLEQTVDRRAFPHDTFVVRFEFPGGRPSRVWFVVEDRVPLVCDDDPGAPVDLVVTSDARDLWRVHVGRLALSAALRSGAVRLDGSADQRSAFTRWFGYSPFAPTARAALAAG